VPNGMPVTLVDQTDSDRVYGAKDLTQTREDILTQLGRGYSVSTAIVAVATGNYLNAVLPNPANSGFNLLFYSRVLSSNIVGGQAPVEYARFASGATLPAAGTPVTVGNRKSGGPASVATFAYQMGSSPLVGTATSAGFIPTGGQEKRIKELVIVPPGGSLCYSVGGSGGGLAAAARLAMTFLFTQEPI